MITPSSLNLFIKNEGPLLGDKIKIKLTLPSALPYFDGHFPGNPILPGIAMIDLSVEALRAQADFSRPLTAIRSAKYLAFVEPNDEIQLECTKNSDNEWQVIWLKENKKVCDLILIFG